MRWERLFDDVEAQWEAQQRRELDAEVADRTRRERALVRFDERLLAAAGGPGGALTVRLAGGHEVCGTPVDVGDGWALVRVAGPAGVSGSAALVSLSEVRLVRGLPTQAAAGREVTLARRFGLGYALRALSRDRATVRVGLVDGAGLVGTIDAVGADSFDLAEHPVDVPRRSANVIAVVTVPFGALAVVRTDG